VSCNNHFIPTSNNVYTLGNSTVRWNEIFCTNATINTSDERGKTSITGTVLGLNFISKIIPIQYKWNSPTGVGFTGSTGVEIPLNSQPIRYHNGFSAQQVKSVLDELEVSTEEFAGYTDGLIKEGVDVKGLRYTEFIAPIVKSIQELKTMIEECKARLDLLEGN
jgi:hypothetical protein